VAELAHQLEHDREFAVVVAGQIRVTTFARVCDPVASAVWHSAGNPEACSRTDREFRGGWVGGCPAYLFEIGGLKRGQGAGDGCEIIDQNGARCA
jgi:hypothetical protein